LVQVGHFRGPLGKEDVQSGAPEQQIQPDGFNPASSQSSKLDPTSSVAGFDPALLTMSFWRMRIHANGPKKLSDLPIQRQSHIAKKAIKKRFQVRSQRLSWISEFGIVKPRVAVNRRV
jgi:hypothetical protein